MVDEKIKNSLMSRIDNLEMPASNVSYGVIDSREEDVMKKRDIAKTEFIVSPDLRWPEVEYPNLKFEKSNKQLFEIVDLMDQLEKSNISEDEKYHFFVDLENKLLETQRELTVIQMVGGRALGENIEKVRSEAARLSFERFGELDSDRFAYYVCKDRKKATEKLRQLDENGRHDVTGRMRKICQRFLIETNGVREPENFKHYELDKEQQATLREDLMVIFPNLNEWLERDEPKEIAVEDSLKYFDEALKIVGIYDKGWRSRFTESNAAEENRVNKTIDVGKNRGPFVTARLKSLAMHEAIHCLRYQNATEQENPAKRLSSHTNTAFEEGLCTSVQQIIDGRSTTAGALYYESLGFQIGLDGSSERDFKDAHEIMWHRYAIINGVKSIKDVRAAKLAAYRTMLRTTRGNAPDARDKSYNDGDQKIKEWFLQILELPDNERREKIRWALSAQFDPTDPIAEKLFKQQGEH